MFRFIAAVFGAILFLGGIGPVVVSAEPPTRGTVSVTCSLSGLSISADAHAQHGLEKAVNNFNKNKPFGRACSLND